MTTTGTSATKALAAVTGASSGIGRELAKQFATNGYDLVICAEDAAGLAAAEGELRGLGAQVQSITADLATYEGVETLAEAIDLHADAVEAVAINAGVGVGGAFSETDLRAELRLIDLNVTGTVHLAKRVLPGMIARRRGRLLFTSSIAAIMPDPFEAIYGASKAFVYSFAEAIRAELKETGITVTALMPGPTETNFFHRAGMDDTKVGTDKKDDPAEVARQGFDALMAGKDHIVAGSFKTKAQAAVIGRLPETVKGEVHKGMAEPGTAKR